MRGRTVVVDITIRIVRTVPEDWEISTIEFTEGSACANNTVSELQRIVERLDTADTCLCGDLSVKYVREATEEDHKNQALEWSNE